ncbi:MAG: alpha/beta hydrolase [Treponema sp.]|nr:alpha/beta hydrolase [Treponema sp.]
MAESFELDGKTVELFGSELSGAPLVLLNAFGNASDGEGKRVWHECSVHGCPRFTLASVTGMDWNGELSPWECPPVRKHDAPFSGRADSYLAFVTDKLIPSIVQHLSVAPAYLVLSGYSLAGLFALYAPYRTNVFSKIASSSPSVWFPGFLDFATATAFVQKPDCVYVSLGDGESKTRNQLLASVQERAERLALHYKSMGIQTAFELNRGNHFADTEIRTAKGILWALEAEGGNKKD